MATSPIQEITAQLERLVELHGFTVIEIGLNTKQADGSRYGATLHFDDATDGTKCVIEHGPTIAAALNKAYRKSIGHRPANLFLVEEAA